MAGNNQGSPVEMWAVLGVCANEVGGQRLSFQAGGGDYRASRPLFVQIFFDHSYVLGAWGTPRNKIDAEQREVDRIHL